MFCMTACGPCGTEATPGDVDSMPNDGEMMSAHATLDVRPARASDREAVLAFCARTWGDEGDYIEHVWDRWLVSEQGVLLVGVLLGEPCALVHLLMVSPTEGWIEGLRVDPRQRRQGIGRVMISRAMSAAHDRGAAVARAIIHNENEASQQLFARFGFERVAALVRYTREPLAERVQEPVSQAGTEAFERIWAWLEQSNLVPLNGGLEIINWRARAVSEPGLREYLATGAVWLLEEWGSIQGLAITRATGRPPADERTLSVRYADGSAEGISRLMRALAARASAQDCQRIEVWLPDLLILHDAMDGAGYARDDDVGFGIYARAL